MRKPKCDNQITKQQDHQKVNKSHKTISRADNPSGGNEKSVKLMLSRNKNV